MLARDRLDRARQDAAAAIRGLTQRSWADADPLSEKAFLAGLESRLHPAVRSRRRP